MASPNVAAQTKDECQSAHLQVQSLRDENKLIEARALALRCAQEDCPELLRPDCSDWLELIRTDLPTVVLRALDRRGNDLVDVVVKLDGAPFARQLDGSSLDVDPGRHLFVFEIPGADPLERQVVIYKGTKNRLIQVGLEPEPPPEPTPLPPPAQPLPAEPRPPDSGASDGLRVAGYVFGGVGLVGLGLFAGFGAAGLAERSDLDGCRPDCPDERVDPVRTKLIAADVALGVGVAALAAGIALIAVSYTDSDESPAAALTVGAAPSPGGGLAQLGLAF